MKKTIILIVVALMILIWANLFEINLVKVKTVIVTPFPNKTLAIETEEIRLSIELKDNLWWFD